MKPVPRMQDVANAAGYSRATVSMALRNDPVIPEATRARIRAVAEQLGYRASPLVAALMSLQRRRRPSTRDTTAIAFLTSHPTTDPARTHFSYNRMLAGASVRAAQALVLAAKALALLDGRFHAAAHDVRAVAGPALNHRIIRNFHGEMERVTQPQLVEAALAACDGTNR